MERIRKYVGHKLLHEKELSILETLKAEIRKVHGDVEFELKESPSSGEVFTKFYELEIYQAFPGVPFIKPVRVENEKIILDRNNPDHVAFMEDDE